MPRQTYTAGEAAQALGISLDTLRRWDRRGLIRTERDAANRRVVPADEVARLTGDAPTRTLSARNRLRGRVREVRVEGLLAHVELELRDPGRVVAVITADSVRELGLRPGVDATAVVKSTSVMIER